MDLHTAAHGRVEKNTEGHTLVERIAVGRIAVGYTAEEHIAGEHIAGDIVGDIVGYTAGYTVEEASRSATLGPSHLDVENT